MDRFAAILAFVRVVDTGGFTSAANRLGVTRAAVSKYVKQLEEHLGVRLLNRTTRRISLTETGATYYDQVSQVLSDLSEAELSASRLNDEPRGILKVAAPMSFGTIHLAPAIGEFMRVFPDVTIQISLSDRFIDLVHEGFDLGLRIGRLANSSLIARRIAPVSVVLVASPDYIAERGVPDSLSELQSHDCLHYGTMESGGTWRLAGPSGEVSAQMNGVLSSDNGEILRAAALAGRGVALLPRFMVSDEITTGSLQQIMPDYSQPEVALHAIYPPNRFLAAKVRVFIDFLVKRYANRPEWEG